MVSMPSERASKKRTSSFRVQWTSPVDVSALDVSPDGSALDVSPDGSALDVSPDGSALVSALDVSPVVVGSPLVPLASVVPDPSIGSPMPLNAQAVRTNNEVRERRGIGARYNANRAPTTPPGCQILFSRVTRARYRSIGALSLINAHARMGACKGWPIPRSCAPRSPAPQPGQAPLRPWQRPPGPARGPGASSPGSPVARLDRPAGLVQIRHTLTAKPRKVSVLGYIGHRD